MWSITVTVAVIAYVIAIVIVHVIVNAGIVIAVVQGVVKWIRGIGSWNWVSWWVIRIGVVECR